MVIAFLVMFLPFAGVLLGPCITDNRVILLISNCIRTTTKNSSSQGIVYDKCYTHVRMYTCMNTTCFHEDFPSNFT